MRVCSAGGEVWRRDRGLGAGVTTAGGDAAAAAAGSGVGADGATGGTTISDKVSEIADVARSGVAGSGAWVFFDRVSESAGVAAAGLVVSGVPAFSAKMLENAGGIRGVSGEGRLDARYHATPRPGGRAWLEAWRCRRPFRQLPPLAPQMAVWPPRSRRALGGERGGRRRPGAPYVRPPAGRYVRLDG